VAQAKAHSKTIEDLRLGTTSNERAQ
jgi:hypothetical protein